MVINRTDCGLMHTTEQDLRAKIQNHGATAKPWRTEAGRVRTL